MPALSRSTRLLALLQALRGRRLPVTAAALAQELEVSERTIYRDIAELAAQGAPIEGEAGIGYVLKPGLFLPPLMLGAEEVEAVLLGLRYVDQRGDAILTSAAASALAKIGAVLAPELQAVLAQPLALPGPSGEAFPENAVPLARLRAAIRHEQALDITYRDGANRETQRIVWPIQLAFMDRARVVAAWCTLRADFRFFRTDRILTAAEAGRYPTRRAVLLPQFRAAVASMSNAPDKN
jgi:predicted DNA-binding transcriptional regulator YafY